MTTFPRLLALAFVASACAGEPEGARLPGDPETPGSGGAPAPWVFLGEVGGTGSVGEITDFDINDRGDVAFLDAMNHRLVLVRSGGATTTLGGRGQGPGEFVLARAVALMDDGSVAALDQAAGRITVWSPQGDLVGTTRVPAQRVHSLVTDGVRLATLVDEGSGIASPDSAGVPVRVLRFDGLTPLAPVHLEAGRRPDGGHGASSGMPFALLDENRFILLRYRGGYDLTLGWLDGADPKRIVRDVPRIPGSPQVVRRTSSRQVEGLRRTARAGGLPENRVPVLPRDLPDSLPPMPPLAELGPFGADRWGRLWVARGMPGPEGSLLDVYDREGFFLGEVHLPGPTLAGIRVRGSWAVGITYGPLDEPTLLLFRVPEGLLTGEQAGASLPSAPLENR